MKKLFTLTLISISIYTSAQINFEYLTIDDGLSSNTIKTIFRDSKDYVWIGTTEGLNKYDGNDVTIYKSIANKAGSISGNNISCIFEDSRKNLWIGTTNGLNLYNRKSDSFIVYKHDTTDSYKNSITCILEDKKGNLWITYDFGTGLHKWDYENKDFISYRIKDQNYNNYINSFTGIQEDSKGNLWVISRRTNIYQFIPETENFILHTDTTHDLANVGFNRTFIDSQDKIWIGSYSNGLFVFNTLTGKLKYFGTNSGIYNINNQFIGDIIQTDNHHILIATNQGGINRYNMVTNTFDYIVQDEKVKNGLNSNGILSLYQDKEGILWVGTTRGGVNYHNPKRYKFKMFEHNTKNPNTLSHNIVGCFYEDSEGLIWIGTDGGGVNVYDPRTGNFTIFKHDSSNPYSISGDVIRCISEDKNGDMWIGTWDAGLNHYDKKTKKFYHYFQDREVLSGISNRTIWHLIIDRNNTLWLSHFSQGIEVFDKEKGVVKRFSTAPRVDGSLSSNIIWLIYEDFEHNIWFCTNNGINRYNYLTDRIEVYNNFPDSIIGAFCMDKEGKLWAGSANKGLFLFEQDGTVVEIYNNQNGLPDNAVHAIVEDDHGNLWISTENGISHFNQKTKKFKNYDKSDGLQGNIFFQQSFLKTKNGEIYFGGYNGFNSFHPDSIADNEHTTPNIYITDFKLFNKSVLHGVPGSPIQNHISETKEITLSWRESVFSFEFAAVNYTNPEKNKYAYIMEGFEKDWNYVGNMRNATYTNMDAGEYTFRVKTFNKNDVENKEGTSIKIIILPPWWETWLFRIIVICAILSLGILFFYYRTYQLRKQKALLSNIVEERTAQLQETNTILEEKQEEIFAQKVTLQEVNTTLEEQAEEIESQNDELLQHRDHLEKLIIERTADLVAAMKKVEESDRLKSAFLSNMSHEIRTPMNAIVGFTSLLDDPSISDEEKKSLISYVKKNSESLLVLIDDILEMSQIQANQLVINNRPVNVIEIMEELLATFQLHVQPNGVELIIDTGPYGENFRCSIDPIRFKQILSNLIGNAIKFTEKGYVKFGITNQSQGFITFYVKDTGIGIPKEVGNSIFERFLKVESTMTKFYEGVGLGLSICNSLVNAMGGNIWYESDLGQGTTFYFTIPHEDKENNKSLGTEEIEKHKIPNLKDKHILIVEDDETNYKVLAFYLKKTKAIISWEKNGLEAFEHFKNNSNFDLILMDIKLPVMNGIEATRRIKKIDPEQIIVAQTAFANKKEKDEFSKYNFNAYLTKPIRMENLMKILDEFLCV